MLFSEAVWRTATFPGLKSRAVGNRSVIRDSGRVACHTSTIARVTGDSEELATPLVFTCGKLSLLTNVPSLLRLNSEQLAWEVRRASNDRLSPQP